MSTKACLGCGIKLQTEHEDKLGYVKDIHHDYCLSCFNLKYRNKSDDGVLKTLFPSVHKDGLILLITSSLHLNTLFSYDLDKFYPTQKKILVINQIDLLPKNLNFDLWVEDFYKEAKIHRESFLEIMPLSALKGHYLDILLETIMHYHNGDTYLVGLQNSGKSTLFNRISKHLEIGKEALSSPKAGLTMEEIKLPFNGHYIIDTPGVYEAGFISDYLSYDDYKGIIPSKRLNPITYQLEERQSVIVGGLLIISIIKGIKGSMTFYLGNINLHRTKYDYVYERFNTHKGTLFSPISSEPYEKKFLKLEDDKYFINLFDIGYVSVSGPITLEIYAPKGANITLKRGGYRGL